MVTMYVCHHLANTIRLLTLYIQLIHISSPHILTPYIPNELRSASECAIKHIHVPNIYILTLYTPNELCGAGECAIKDIHLVSLGHGSQELYAHASFF